jgi:hypothetical protein
MGRIPPGTRGEAIAGKTAERGFDFNAWTISTGKIGAVCKDGQAGCNTGILN